MPALCATHVTVYLELATRHCAQSGNKEMGTGREPTGPHRSDEYI